MDGGAVLLDDFRRALSPEVAAEVLSYPPDLVSDYDDLEQLVGERLAASRRDTALVAESFSGPLAIRIGASPPPNLRCVVLVATFDRAPAPRLWSYLIGSAMFHWPPPAFVVRQLMLGTEATSNAVRRVQDAIRIVGAPVLAERLRSVLRVEVAEHAAAIELPVLYVRARQDRLVRRPLAVPARSNWQQEVIEGPHLILQRHPVECAALVTRFIRENM